MSSESTTEFVLENNVISSDQSLAFTMFQYMIKEYKETGRMFFDFDFFSAVPIASFRPKFDKAMFNKITQILFDFLLLQVRQDYDKNVLLIGFSQFVTDEPLPSPKKHQ